VQALRQLENVEVLNLRLAIYMFSFTVYIISFCSSNKISTLEDVAYCKYNCTSSTVRYLLVFLGKSLRELFIRKNKISSFTELEHLKQLPNLTVLWLSENPLVTTTNYRLHVIQALPHLKKLDNKGKASCLFNSV